LSDFERKKAQILDRVGILDVVSEHVSLRRVGARWVGLCPFHNEKTPSFTVNPDLAIFKCFGCGRGGDVFTFLQLRENLSFMDALRMLADRVGVELTPTRSDRSAGPDRLELAKVNAWAASFFRLTLLHQRQGAAARQYVRRRGITDESSERFQIGLALGDAQSIRRAGLKAGFSESLLLAADLVRRSDDGRIYDTFRDRLIFPIRDVTNRVIGFGGRTLVDERAKYLNTRQTALFDKGRNLYGLDLARRRITELNRSVLVEGYTDCIAAHQAGFCETVATLGTALTDRQVELLRRYGDEVIVLFDSDEAGNEAASRAIALALPRHMSIRLARIAEGKDPSEFLEQHPASAFSDLLNGAVDALEFKWQALQRQYAAGPSERKQREAITDFIRLVAQACGSGSVDVIQRGLISNRLGRLLQVDSREVDELIIRFQRQRSPGPSQSSSPTPQPEELIPADAEQLAFRHLLEVLFNEPGLLKEVPPDLALDRIADARDRRIAGHMFRLGHEWGDFKLADVVACCTEDGDAERVAALADRGAKLSNYRAKLELALSRIKSFEEVREVERAKESLDEAGSLRSVNDYFRKRSHFAPARFTRGKVAQPSANDEQSS
jgi:DNA primase